jgi:hypothetical protein
MTYVCLSFYVLHCPFNYWSILSIHLLEYIIHYSIGVQIPLCNLFGLQFEVIYFLNSKSFLLAWSQITSIASKLFDMVQV